MPEVSEEARNRIHLAGFPAPDENGYVNLTASMCARLILSTTLVRCESLLRPELWQPKGFDELSQEDQLAVWAEVYGMIGMDTLSKVVGLDDDDDADGNLDDDAAPADAAPSSGPSGQAQTPRCCRETAPVPVGENTGCCRTQGDALGMLPTVLCEGS